MKDILKEKVPEHIEEKEIYICDICGKATKYKSYDRMQELRYKDEKNSWGYPDCGETIEYVYDFCEDCTKNIIMPLIEKEYSKKPRKSVTEW